MEPNPSDGRLFNDRYLVEDVIGRGGMAAVWRGRDLRLDRPVAIKVLAAPWVGDPAAMKRVDREARIAARLAHPNIVAVHDVGVHHTSPYLVMELIDGETVAQLIAQGPIPIPGAIAIAAQTCDGLAVAHAAGVIHRDIKPANLMLTPIGVVKICDFGIAHALAGIADQTVSGPTYAVGTTRYMAPEQAYGHQADARADLYALGCTLYAMLTGAPPFSGDAVEILRQHLGRPPVPLRQLRADVPVALENLAASLLAKNPADRPSDAGEVKTWLASLLPDPTAAVISMSSDAPVAVSLGAVAPPRPAAVSSLPAPSPAGPVPSRRAVGAAAVAARSRDRLHAPRLRPWRVAALAAAVALVAVPITLAAAARSPYDSASPDSAFREGSGILVLTTSASATPATPTAAQAVPVTPSPTAAPAGRASRTRAPTSQPSSQTPNADPIAAMRVTIQNQVNTGNLNPDKASDLYKKVDELARAIADDNMGDATRKIRELRDKVASLYANGQLTSAGYDALTRDIDAIEATLP